MSRPVLLSILPNRLKAVAYHRWFNPVPPAYTQLFRSSELSYAPGVTMELVYGDVSHGCIALTGFIELTLTRHIRERALRGGLLVDVGANAGYFSLLWAAARMENRVVTFEASPRNVDLLRRNIDRNGMAERIQLNAFAAGKQQGVLAFECGPKEQTGWGGFALRAGADTIDVEVRPLDDVIKEYVDVLKIDVEGADTWVLMGCRRLLGERKIGTIFFEQNKPRLRALSIDDDAAVYFLSEMGYRARRLGRAGSDLVEWMAEPE